MKAIKILKKIYKNNPDTRIQRNNVDVNFTIHDFNNINEAIKELEELENRSCDSCKYFHQGYLCIELGCGSIKPKEVGMKYCDKWVK